MRSLLPFAALVLAGGSSYVTAQGVGTKMPPAELADFTQTPAKSFEDYLGRAVLIEFFAFW